MKAQKPTPIGIESITEKGDGSYAFRYQCLPVSFRNERVDAEAASTIINHAFDNGLVKSVVVKQPSAGMFYGKAYKTDGSVMYVLEQNALSTMLPDQTAVDAFVRWNASSYDDSRRRSIITGRFK